MNTRYKKLLMWLFVAVFGYHFIQEIIEIQNSKLSNDWKRSDRKALIEKCKIDSDSMNDKYPKLINQYCVCSSDKIISYFSKEEYLKISDDSISVQLEKILPVINDCRNQLNMNLKNREFESRE